MKFSPLSNFEELATDAGSEFPELLGNSGYLKRVGAFLRIYASSLTKDKGTLKWINVLDPSNGKKLHPELLTCIESLPAETRTPKRHAKYKSDLRSNLTHIILRVIKFYSAANSEFVSADDSFALESLPKVVQEIWPYLPREGALRNKKRTLEERALMPLTKVGIHILRCMLELVELHDLDDLEQILITHTDDFYILMRRKCPPKMWGAITGKFSDLRKKMGYEKLGQKRKSLDLTSLPTFCQQWELFEKQAPSGIEEGEYLSERANHFGIEVNAVKSSSIDRFREVLQAGLFQIIKHLEQSPSYSGDLSVVDLLRIEPVTRALTNGSTRVENANVLVDVYRQIERSAERGHSGKRANRDSVTFGNFIIAIKAIAAYNDLFEYREAFDQAYGNLRFDHKAAAKRSAHKKKILDRPWLDEEISRLGEEFSQVVKERTFVRDKSDGRSHKVSDRNMRLCLFYVVLLTLRYLGFRQQAIRNCTVGKNIIFKKDGTILFHYDADEVKNEVEINIPLRREKDPQKDTHGLLYDVLITYYTKVYPHIKENTATDLEEQFFVKLRLNGKFIRHQKDKKGAKRNRANVNFYQYFRSACCAFLLFEDRAAKLPTLINPHFLRGLCADWLFHDCKVSIEKIADYLGDLVETVKKKYLTKSKVRDGGPAIMEAGENQKARLYAENAIDIEQQIKQMKAAHKAQLAEKDKQLQERTDDVRRANERADRTEERNSYLEAKLEKKELETAELLKKIDDNQAEFFSILKSSGGTDNIPTPAA
ncbi:MAG: hypothetical protein QOH63_1614 [Acidobacteriota bacterium]|jgi:hypothetical protein|nr:hypothetical protein [Acidobacteriota bacterium]